MLPKNEYQALDENSSYTACFVFSHNFVFADQYYDLSIYFYRSKVLKNSENEYAWRISLEL